MGLPIRFTYYQHPQQLTLVFMRGILTVALGHPPASDPVEYMADLMIYAELGYYVVPALVHAVARQLQHDIADRDVWSWEANRFRELLESVRLELGYSDLRFAARTYEKRRTPSATE